jgi:hypothetical protein
MGTCIASRRSALMSPRTMRVRMFIMTAGLDLPLTKTLLTSVTRPSTYAKNCTAVGSADGVFPCVVSKEDLNTYTYLNPGNFSSYSAFNCASSFVSSSEPWSWDCSA